MTQIARVGTTLVALALAMSDSAMTAQNTVTLNVSISNQSLVQKNARLTVWIDGAQVFSATMPVRSQHYYRQFTLPLAPGEHLLRVEEAATQTTETVRFDVERDTWVRVKFVHQRQADRHSFQVDRSPSPIPTK